MWPRKISGINKWSKVALWVSGKHSNRREGVYKSQRNCFHDITSISTPLFPHCSPSLRNPPFNILLALFVSSFLSIHLHHSFLLDFLFLTNCSLHTTNKLTPEVYVRKHSDLGDDRPNLNFNSNTGMTWELPSSFKPLSSESHFLAMLDGHITQKWQRHRQSDMPVIPNKTWIRIQFPNCTWHYTMWWFIQVVNLTYQGRRNLNWEIFSIRLACRHVCGHFWLTDGGKHSPLWWHHP